MKIYNTMSRKKEDLVPIREGHVGIYACGPTVYDFFHIGNARPFIMFDVLRRYLLHKGYKVTFVQNFTDIDDRLINKAIKEGTTVPEVAERYIQEYYVDAEALGVLKADVHPRATEHIGEIIKLIAALEQKGLAYAVNGDVYYNTEGFAPYGRLSGQNLTDREAGARIEVDDIKRNPMDFALWKAQKPGEPAWPSPWGLGRPGWHIECSAMSMKYLGETFDIHCGGVDLIFPHHENEIAQSEGATGHPFANYWMHNGHINIDNQKMSKSLGNFFTVRDISKEYDLEAVRMFMLSAHYRSPINFARDMIEQAKASLDRLYNARDNALFLLDHAQDKPMSDAETAFVARGDQAVAAFDTAMEDDLNTADALGAIFEYIRDMNTLFTDANQPSAAVLDAGLKALTTMTDVLGLLRRQLDTTPPEVLALVEARAQAKKDKNFGRADALRQQALAMGYVIEDTPKGPKVKRA